MKCQTNKPGIFACGDVTTVPFKQINIAMGEGSKAALSAFEYYHVAIIFSCFSYFFQKSQTS